MWRSAVAASRATTTGMASASVKAKLVHAVHLYKLAAVLEPARLPTSLSDATQRSARARQLSPRVLARWKLCVVWLLER